MTIVDTHTHVVSKDIRDYPLEPLGGRQSDWSRDRPVTFEQMVAAMDQAGISKAVLVQASTCYGHDNSYVADAVAAHPDRFTGVFSVDVLASDAPEKIRHWLSRGCSGMRLFTKGSTMPTQADWIDDPRSFPAWECAGDVGIPVCVQMSIKAIPRLVKLVERFRRVRVILDHLARPVLEDGPPYVASASLFGLARYPNIYLKVTSRTFVDSRSGKATPESFFGQLVAEFGASRISWGSNYPASEGTLVELLGLASEGLGSLSSQDRECILAKTAQTLYPVLADK